MAEAANELGNSDQTKAHGEKPMRYGPFLRERPTAVTTIQTLAWCMIWLDDQGRVFAIEWLD